MQLISSMAAFFFSLFSLLFFSSPFLVGCAPETMVFTGTDVIPIERAFSKTKLLSLSSQWKLFHRSVRHYTECWDEQDRVTLVFDQGETVTVALDQQFFLFYEQQWIKAEDLCPGQNLLNIGNKPCIIRGIARAGPGSVIKLDVGEPHTFFISHWCILTHNCEYLAPLMQLSSQEIAAALAVITAEASIGQQLLEWSAQYLRYTPAGVLLSVPVAPALLMIAGAGACTFTEEEWKALNAARGFDVGVVMPEEELPTVSYASTNEIPQCLIKAAEAASKSGKIPRPEKPLIFHVSPRHHPVSILDINTHRCGLCNSIRSPGPKEHEGQFILEYLSFPIRYDLRIAYIPIINILIIFRKTRELPQGTLFHGYYYLDKAKRLGEKVMGILRSKGILDGKGKLDRLWSW